MAIPYTKSIFELVTLVLMCFFSTLIFVFITFILVLVIGETKSIALPDQYYGNWFFGVPILGFCLALTSIINMTLLRIKSYKLVGTLALIQNTVFAFVALLTTQIQAEINGLIISKIFGVLVSLIFGVYYFLKFPVIKLIMRSISRIQFADLIIVYKKYIDFIRYNFPLSLFGILTRDVMVVLLSFSHGIKYAGLYSLARIVQEVPINLLSGSLGVLFFGETAVAHANREIPVGICNQIRMIFLFFISVVFPIYLFSSFWAVELFTLIFGGSWAASGFIFMILMPYGILSMLSSWQTRVFEALGQQRILFKYQTIFESSGIFAGFWMSSQGYDYNAIIAVAFSFFARVPIFVTLTVLKQSVSPEVKSIY